MTPPTIEIFGEVGILLPNTCNPQGCDADRAWWADVFLGGFLANLLYRTPRTHPLILVLTIFQL